jgi:hypothetical protein
VINGVQRVAGSWFTNDEPHYGMYYPYDGLLQMSDTREDAEADLAYAQEQEHTTQWHMYQGATLVEVTIKEVKRGR